MVADIIIIVVTIADVTLNKGRRDLSECPVHSRCSGVFIESLYKDLGRKWGERAG